MTTAITKFQRKTWTQTTSAAEPAYRQTVRLTAPEQRPAPTPQPFPEEEADRWVAEALFDCYNN
jgi:hypothetical protein